MAYTAERYIEASFNETWANPAIVSAAHYLVSVGMGVATFYGFAGFLVDTDASEWIYRGEIRLVTSKMMAQKEK